MKKVRNVAENESRSINFFCFIAGNDFFEKVIREQGLISKQRVFLDFFRQADPKRYLQGGKKI